MARRKSKTAVSQSRLFVLALGLLVGFVTAFVLILSRLPMDVSLSHLAGEGSQESQLADMSFEYYSVLPEQQAAHKPLAQSVAVEPPVVFMEPPTRVEPSTRIEPRRPAVAMPQIVKRSIVQPEIASASENASAPAPAPAPALAPAPVPEVRTQAGAPAPEPIKEILASESGQDTYYVEAGNYREELEAQSVRSSLRSLGLDAFVVVRQNNAGGVGHRVRIGPFFEQSRLDDTRNKLRASGIKSRLIRVKQ